MSFIQTSLSSAILIVAVLVMRKLTLNQLPKRVFLALWAVVVCKLMVPVSLPSRFSVYTLLNWALAKREEVLQSPPVYASAISEGEPMQSAVTGVLAGQLLWLGGAIIFALFFAISYCRCRREFETSLPVKNTFATRWLSENKLLRPLQIRQSDRIKGPLTYGVFKPVILLPKSIDFANEEELDCVLCHEMVHIRRYDALTKLILAAVLSVHWFNPLVWLMYNLANQDLELSCDEAVIKTIGESKKSLYARTLITMEEKKYGLPLHSHFSQNTMEERILSIMNMKKLSLTGMMLTLTMIAGTTTAFATTAQPETIPAAKLVLKEYYVDSVKMTDIVNSTDAIKLIPAKSVDGGKIILKDAKTGSDIKWTVLTPGTKGVPMTKIQLSKTESIPMTGVTASAVPLSKIVKGTATNAENIQATLIVEKAKK